MTAPALSETPGYINNLNQSCAKFYAADESPAPSAPKRDIEMDNSAVEFTANERQEGSAVVVINLKTMLPSPIAVT